MFEVDSVSKRPDVLSASLAGLTYVSSSTAAAAAFLHSTLARRSLGRGSLHGTACIWNQAKELEVHITLFRVYTV